MNLEITKKMLKVDGMTCGNCELKIEKEIKKLSGVYEVKASYSKGNVYIEYDESKIKISDIIEKINIMGYKAKEVKSEKEKLPIGQLMGVLGIAAVIFVLTKNTLGLNFMPEINEPVSYGILFAVGLLTSLHCIAMCGGINLSQCIMKNTMDAGVKNSGIRPSIMYNAGRVISYTAIGGIVGALGSVLSFSGRAKGIVAFAAGIFMILMAFNMLNIFPQLKGLMPKMPKFIGSRIYEGRRGKGPFIVGLLNGLMPCGPLQTMQLYALGTGSAIKGAASMFAFSMGTVPLMFAFGALSTLFSKKFTDKMMKLSATLVMVLGFVMILRGMALSGFAAPSDFISSNSPKQIETAVLKGNKAKIVGNEQIVAIDLQPGSYAPIVVQKGIPVKFNIKAAAESINGCNNAVIIPEYGIEKVLQPGDNIIEFTPEKEGVIPYSCWMGMIRSKITVVSDLNNISEELQKESNSDDTGTGGLFPGLKPCCQ